MIDSGPVHTFIESIQVDTRIIELCLTFLLGILS